MTNPTPHRWTIAAMLFAATVINYVDRQALSVAASTITKELGLSNTQYADILTAFLIPYTVMYVFSGLLVDRWGTKVALAVFIAWWSAANALHALATTALLLGVFRFLLGLGESGNFMAAIKAISEWFPPKERAFANGLVNAAAATGAILSPPLISWAVIHFGWRAAFVATGALGFVWLAVWLAVYGKTPPQPEAEVKAKVPYSTLLRMPQSWGLLFARVLADPIWWFYLFWLPKYLQDVRHFSLAQIGLFAWMPYLSADLGSLAGGWLSGRFIARGLDPVAARLRAMIPAALAMPLGIAVAYLDSTPAIALICLATFSHMAWKTNLMTMTNDVYPTNVVGSAAGLVGLGSGLAGAWSTPAVGRIVDAFGYESVFWMFGFLHILATALVWVTTRARR